MRRRVQTAKIQTGGKAARVDVEDDLTASLSRLMPERWRISRKIISEDAATDEERKWAVKDLFVMASRDYLSLHLPGEGIDDGRCPRRDCK